MKTLEAKTLIILGSARKQGNTLKAVTKIYGTKLPATVDLLDLNIQPYCYERSRCSNDDFIPTIEHILNYEVIVFATPVYWYAMSGLMKIFFDRMTELITTNKPLGRALKGKVLSVVACGTDPQVPLGFEIPFQLTAKYFEMEFEKLTYIQTLD